MRVKPDQIINGFEASYYLLTQPDVAAQVSIRWCTSSVGWMEGRNPNGLFECPIISPKTPTSPPPASTRSRTTAPGAAEGRNLRRRSTRAYLAANPDVASSGVNPLEHYLQYGAFEGRAIAPIRPSAPPATTTGRNRGAERSMPARATISSSRQAAPTPPTAAPASTRCDSRNFPPTRSLSTATR